MLREMQRVTGRNRHKSFNYNFNTPPASYTEQRTWLLFLKFMKVAALIVQGGRRALEILPLVRVWHISRYYIAKS